MNHWENQKIDWRNRVDELATDFCWDVIGDDPEIDEQGLREALHEYLYSLPEYKKYDEMISNITKFLPVDIIAERDKANLMLRMRE